MVRRGMRLNWGPLRYGRDVAWLSTVRDLARYRPEHRAFAEVL